MKLTGKQLKQLHDALLDAFSPSDLQRMVTFELDENLDAIAGGGNLSQTIFNLIQWSERRGRTVDLVQGAVNQNDNNADLLAVRDALLGAPTADESSPQSTPAGGTVVDQKVNEVKSGGAVAGTVTTETGGTTIIGGQHYHGVSKPDDSEDEE